MSTLEDYFTELESAPTWRKAWWRVQGVVHRLPGKPRWYARNVKWAWQRVTRGWDDRSAWDLCSSLPRTLGAQLTYLGIIVYGHPVEYPGGFDQWGADLRTHGAALTAYDPDEVETHDSAREALRWVADNLGALWD